MPRLRLFGPAAEAAGTKRDNVPGSSVDEVLNAARARYGDPFTRVAASCRVWVNREVPGPEMVLGGGGGVALLPPVSGG